LDAPARQNVEDYHLQEFGEIRAVVFAWPNPRARVTLSSVTPPAISRLAWIDWMRGLACVLMFQTHCYDAWLGGNSRNTNFLQGSQLLGTLPAPLFLFLAGISFALVTGKLIGNNLRPAEITLTMARRGAEILAFGFLFRLQEFVIAWGWAPWSDLLRVDILNIIGVSMILMALTCGITLKLCEGAHVSYRRPVSRGSYEIPPSGTPQPAKSHLGLSRSGTAIAGVSIAVASLIALLTPPLYTSWRPIWMPWPLESYIDGCHNLGSPQPWIFPLFPWAAFAFTGLAAGFILFSEKGRARSAQALALFAVTGALAMVASQQFDHSSIHLYATYDYWHTSPNFFMLRVGLLLVISFFSYGWCRWGLATRGFSPLIQLGQTSLLVYWVHIEFVYGRFSLLPKRAEAIPTATRGFIEITLFMLILSLIRTRIDWNKIDWENRKLKINDWKKIFRRAQPA
jgi:uncharacterized membrane protein